MATETLSRPSVSNDTEQINAENLSVDYKPEDTTSVDSERESLTTFTTLDWTATLSPARRSCINLTNVEPCVNKAMVNLQALKEALLLKACLHYETPPETVTVSVVDSKEQPKSVSVQVSTTADSDPTGLSVEGVRTGILVEKYGIIEKVRIPLL